MTSKPVTDLRGLAGFVLISRFLTELALLGGLAAAGARLGGGAVLGVALAVLLPVTAAVVWGAAIAPRARRRLPEPGRFLVELVLFGAAGLAVARSGWPVAGILLAVTGIGFAALTRVFAKDD
ncbi:YrdB family protein [Actinosynnema sp. NPDC049800]